MMTDHVYVLGEKDKVVGVFTKRDKYRGAVISYIIKRFKDLGYNQNLREIEGLIRKLAVKYQPFKYKDLSLRTCKIEVDSIKYDFYPEDIAKQVDVHTEVKDDPETVENPLDIDSDFMKDILNLKLPLPLIELNSYYTL